ncbi:type II toxin-antitoxin system VapC family toxin [Microbacterium sp. 179-I 3D3 NHS]|uniref:type II toxin-antitoxin system VapC family toxin n=1 Tax=unclassified Microbacterium TaxID=2609290 RepID=UPI0039A1F642
MIVDTSALIAILKGEPERERFTVDILENRVAISAGTLAEAFIVAGGIAGEAGVREIEAVIRDADVTVVPVDLSQSRLMSRAHLAYGRGSGHPARLNYGDCFSYALAISRDEPLLFTGDDFVHTDVRRVE